MTTGLAAYARQAAAIARDLRRLQADAAPPIADSAIELARRLGLVPDPWQAAVLRSDARNLLLLASRQAGKSTVAGVLALQHAVARPGALVLIVSPTERQSKLLLKTIRRFYDPLRSRVPPTRDGVLSLELRNGSEVHALPGKEATIRGFADVALLVLDEAARIDDDLYTSVRPMLAVSGGRLLALSTPFGRRGWFYREWSDGGPDWHRTRVTAAECPRIDRGWLLAERDRIGVWAWEQEFMCAFKDAVDAYFRAEDIAAMASAAIAPLFPLEVDAHGA